MVEAIRKKIQVL